MITANVLNPNAVLNSFKIVNSLDFVPGSPLKLILQLFDDTEQLRFVPPTSAIVSIMITQTDNTQLSIVGSMNPDDRSLVTFQISGLQTTNLFGGNILLSIDLLGDGTDIQLGLVENVLSKLALNC
jgi:hypothetical protein